MDVKRRHANVVTRDVSKVTLVTATKAAHCCDCQSKEWLQKNNFKEKTFSKFNSCHDRRKVLPSCDKFELRKIGRRAKSPIEKSPIGISEAMASYMEFMFAILVTQES